VINTRILLPFAALLVHIAAPVYAQESVGSLDQLLIQVESVSAGQKELFEQRRSEFNSANAQQQSALMQSATEQRSALDAKSKQLADQYAANELRISGLNAELRDKSAGLGLSELFGVARQVANDAASILQQSLITTQYPAAEGKLSRDQFLRDFAASGVTPSARELERVWVEIQREMTASGKVARYKAPVVQLGGEAIESDVVRVGPFNVTSGGQFLKYVPSLRTLTVLPRQLPAMFTDVATGLENATEGYVDAVVDSSRGVLVGLYIERPSFWQRIELGEEIGYVIIFFGVLGLIAFLTQLVTLNRARVSVGRQLQNLDNPTSDNPLGRVLLAFKGDKNMIEQDADVAELRITEAVLREVPRLERAQAFLRLCVAAGPLLGLIGTVVGMIITFQSITESGSSDPKLMANGIGQAMIATVLGLGIAIPLLFANALLTTLSKSIVQILDEQSAGILAESIEKQRRV
jgi:biopolymer transport protein ExbB